VSLHIDNNKNDSQLSESFSSEENNLSAPPVDLSLIKTAVQGKIDITQKLVDHLLKIYPEHLENIKGHIERHDAELLRQTAHTLKGTVANFGAHTAVALAQQLEKSGKESRFDQAGEILLQLKEEMKRIDRFFTEAEWQKEFQE